MEVNEIKSVSRSFTYQSGGKTGVITREIVCCPCEWLSEVIPLTTANISYLEGISIIIQVIILKQMFAAGS